MSEGPTIGGGGSIAVNTASMLRAAALLETAGSALGTLITRTGVAIDGCAPGTRRMRLADAQAHLAQARAESEHAASGLRTAAFRYGLAEHAAQSAQQAAWAGSAAGYGAVTGMLEDLFGAGAVAGSAAVLVDAVVLGVSARTAVRWLETGEVQPQLDPVLLTSTGYFVSALDDARRGAAGVETLHDLLHDDPGSAYGSAVTAGALAGVLTRTPGSPMTVTRTSERRVRRPADLGAMLERIPDGAAPGGQVVVERYDGAGGPHAVVYIAGTVTFRGDGGEQPFDSASNLYGVAGVTTDAERAVTAALEQAGVGRDEPLLLVGHSQGALTAVRVAQHAGYRVGGVLEAGGPTGQLVLPADVPRLAVEHDEDLVPKSGGVPAAGAEGLRRVLVTRSLDRGGAAPGAAPLRAGFPAHEMPRYAETLRQAQALGGPPMSAYLRGVDAFLDAPTDSDGTATRYRAQRLSAAPVPTAAAAAGR